MNQEPEYKSIRYTISHPLILQMWENHKKETGLSDSQITEAAISEYFQGQSARVEQA